MRSLVAGALALLASGCLKADVNRCDNGAICKHAQACTEANAGAPQCGLPEDVAACFGMPEHTACTHAAAAGAAGSCRDNLCGDCNANWAECRYSTWTPMDSGTTSKINALQALVSPTDVYAAADGSILHYDGLAWTALPAPTGSIYFDLWGPSSSLFIVDQDKDIYRNGTVEPNPPSIAMRSVWGTIADLGDNVFAVGKTIVGHRSSAGWSYSGTAPIGTTYEIVNGVGGTAIVAGANSSGAALWTAAGTATTPFTPAMPSPTAAYVPKAVWGTSTSDFFVVGAIANADPFIYRFSSGAWTAMTTPPGAKELFGVWGRTTSDVYAVGDAGTILHFDGTAWTAMTPPSAVVDLKAIDGFDRDVFVAGSTGAIWKYAEL